MPIRMHGRDIAPKGGAPTLVFYCRFNNSHLLHCSARGVSGAGCLLSPLLVPPAHYPGEYVPAHAGRAGSTQSCRRFTHPSKQLIKRGSCARVTLFRN